MSQEVVYRIILRAKRDGTWRIVFIAGKERLFTLPFNNPDQATWMAAKLVDELLCNKQDFVWDVQDENGVSTRSMDLMKVAQKRKVRNSA
jgi:hypothetical protein